MKKIFQQVIRFFGLRGSWPWALRQMSQGKIVRPESASGTVKYKFDDLSNKRIVYDFSRYQKDQEWDSANIFMADFINTDWIIFDWSAN